LINVANANPSINRAAKVEIYGNAKGNFYFHRMNLAIDIGNTRVKGGYFNEDQLVDSFVSDEIFSIDLLKSWFNQPKVDRIILATVRALAPEITSFCASQQRIHLVSHQSKLPIQLAYETPETLGIDRICGVVAAAKLFPNEAVLVIDAGTCITYDLIDANRVYHGGAISPGVQMRLNAMHQFTEKLPQLTFLNEIVTIGTTTSSSMKLGAGQGALAEMNGMINYFKASQPNLKVILTGGDAHFFEQHAENAIFAAPNLILIGLNVILLFDRQP
jgi:type III pantothenate kinase